MELEDFRELLRQQLDRYRALEKKYEEKYEKCQRQKTKIKHLKDKVQVAQDQEKRYLDEIAVKAAKINEANDELRVKVTQLSRLKQQVYEFEQKDTTKDVLKQEQKQGVLLGENCKHT